MISKDIKALSDVGKEVVPGVNVEKTKYMFMPHHQTTGQSHYVNVASNHL
jgi:hypothetical protein